AGSFAHEQHFDEQLAIDRRWQRLIDELGHDRLAIGAADLAVHTTGAQRLAQARWMFGGIILGKRLDVYRHSARRRPLEQIGAIESELIAHAAARDLAIINPPVDLRLRRTQ